MPSASHPQAKFDPVPPDLDLNALVEKTPNFDYVIRISVDQIEEIGIAEFEKLVLLHVIVGGKPLVVEDWQKLLAPWTFSAQWLSQEHGAKGEKLGFCSVIDCANKRRRGDCTRHHEFREHAHDHRPLLKQHEQAHTAMVVIKFSRSQEAAPISKRYRLSQEVA